MTAKKTITKGFFKDLSLLSSYFGLPFRFFYFFFFLFKFLFIYIKVT